MICIYPHLVVDEDDYDNSLLTAVSYIPSGQSSVDNILLDPRYANILAIVKAARNGAVYGAKVRFPHALV